MSCVVSSDKDREDGTPHLLKHNCYKQLNDSEEFN